MGPIDADWLMRTLIVAPPLLLSLTLHEYAHARVALAFGDPTAYYKGRCSLNPLRHLDPIGTLMLLFSGMFGWAKPVPVNHFNLHPRRLGDIAVSAAGPLTNLALAVICALLVRILTATVPADSNIGVFVVLMLEWTVMANLGLCFFNAIPLFPLDGHHIVRELLPARQQDGFMRWQMTYGSMVLLAMLVGPRLVEIVTGKPLPINPLTMYFRAVVLPLLDLMVGT